MDRLGRQLYNCAFSDSFKTQFQSSPLDGLLQQPRVSTVDEAHWSVTMASQGRERGRWPDSPGQGSAVPLTGAFASMSVSDPSRMQQGSISSGQVATHNDLSNQDDSSLGDQPDPLPLRSIPGSSQFTQHADSLRDAQPFSGRPEHGYMQNIPPAMHQFHQPASFEEHSQGQYGYPQMAYGRHIPYVYNMPFYARQPQSETLFADRYAAHTAHAPDGGLQLDGQRASSESRVSQSRCIADVQSDLTQIHSIPGTVETGMHGRRIARGPPRRPKQTGPAIWVGNLPPNADIIIELKDHFARDAVDDIESVYLNTLTRFAFVNYKNDSSCEAALQRCNDSFFHGMRLSCQPRSRALGLSEPKTSDAQSDVPQLSPPVLGTGVSEILEGPSAVAPRTATQSDGAKPPTSHDRSEPAMAHESITDNLPTSTSESRSEAARVSERFFIIKSLTIEDLDASARDGTWATQNHNERRLNEAFKVRSLAATCVKKLTGLVCGQCISHLSGKQVWRVFWICQDAVID